MTVELPKDAEGREIPLDTVCMYDCNGDPVSVTRWCFTTRLDSMFSEKNIWIAIDKERLVKDPALLYITPPDSIKQLAEDLNRAWDVGNAQEKGCRYMSCYYDKDRGAHCNDCRLNSHGKINCLDAMMADIVSRVNRLAGDSK